MRFILYSDLQAHPWKEFSSTDANGINTRFQHHIDVLNQILEYAIANGIGHIFFGGDMFEARAKVDVIVAKMIAEWKWKVSKAGIDQIDVVGNHDLYDKSTMHNAIDLYRNIPGQTIVTEPQVVDGVYCIPYMHRLDDVLAAIKNAPSINKPFASIVHYGLYDVPTESQSVIKDLGYETEGQVRLTDLEPLTSNPNCKFVFFGHFHVTHAVTPRVHFIGTPLQHKWGERSVQTRFLDVDLDADRFTAVLTKAPKFMQFESLDTIVPEKIKGNFCRAYVSSQEEKEKAESLFTSNEALGSHAIVKPKAKEAENRLGLNLGMSFEEMGMKLVDNDPNTTLDKAKLKQVLLDAFKEAQQKKGL